MTVTFGSIEFDQVLYDDEADVLYLSVSESEPVHWEESREGHVLRFDASGELCAITIIGVTHHMGPDRAVQLTVPRREELGLQNLGFAVA